MKKLLWVAGALVLFVIAYASVGFAQDQTDTGTTPASGSESTTTSPGGGDSGKDWKQEMAGDKAAIKAQRDTVKDHASASRQEESQLRDQIRTAEQSGDTATAQQLRAQLKTAHEGNVQEMQQDKQTMRSARQELNQDKKEARTDRMDKNNDGTVDKTERAQYRHHRGNHDKDNNPPGPRGGRGTNWENKPGPKGGPGASPDKGNQGVRDHGRGQGRDGRGQGGEHRGGGGGNHGGGGRK